MNRHFITTCGTSIMRGRSLAPEDAESAIDARIRETSGNPDFLRQLSAETNSLLVLESGRKDHVTLIATNTDDGAVCANAIRKLIEAHFGSSVEIETVEGLQVNDAVIFKTRGVSNLFKKLTEVRLRHNDLTAILNVTGGFKAVVPYMVLYGLFNELEMVYLFEKSEQFIKLPPAPLGIDFFRAGQFIDTLLKVDEDDLITREDFQKMAEKVPFNDREFFESLFYEESGYMFFSAFGEIVIDKYRTGIFKVKISPEALKKLDSTKGELRKKLESLLSKISTPSYREEHIDPGWTGVTDLMVTKPGNVAERAAFFTKAGIVYICELFTDHDKYERRMQHAKIADYEVDGFTEYLIVGGTSAPDDGVASEMESEELIGIEQQMEENKKLRQTIQKLNAELIDTKAELKSLKNFHGKKKSKRKKPKSKTSGA